MIKVSITSDATNLGLALEALSKTHHITINAVQKEPGTTKSTSASPVRKRRTPLPITDNQVLHALHDTKGRDVYQVCKRIGYPATSVTDHAYRVVYLKLKYLTDAGYAKLGKPETRCHRRLYVKA